MQCARCNKSLWGYNGNKRYCSDKCRKVARKIRENGNTARKKLLKELRDKRRELKLNTLVDCKYCGVKYKRSYTRQKYCSVECMEKRIKEQRASYLDRVKDKTSEYNRNYYAQKCGIVPKDMICKYCGGSFVRQSSAQKYCSLTCRTIHWKRKIGERRSDENLSEQGL